MFQRWAAPVLVLALCTMLPSPEAAQQASRGNGAGTLGTSYPNPFNPVIHIPFSVGDVENCGVSEQHVVTMRILNILAQPVVTPVLNGAAPGTTTISTSLSGRPITNLTLPCGRYEAFWDGIIAATHRKAASGTYAVQIIVDGRLAATKKIFHAK